jgi:glycosyltransferase involved in cell wall biosynthesis
MGLPDDGFVIGMVAANKANRILHRKAFAENLLAVSFFMKENPNAYLYLHTEPTPAYQGFDLQSLLRVTGVPASRVIFADPQTLRMGYTRKQMAALYSTMDVLLAPSYGEGFGVPTIEAQACGTRVIGSGWAATPDLLGPDSWAVDGHVFWDEGQQSWFKVPDVSAIVKALGLAADEPRGGSEQAANFAQQFAVETVWDNHWLPFWRNYFGA